MANNGVVAAALCKGGTVAHGGCRHCRNLLKARALPRITVQGEILPIGAWPSNGASPVPPNGGNGQLPKQGPVIDLGRYQFLAGLNTFLQVDGFLGRRKVPYKGFVFRGGMTGQPLAVVDCSLTENAAYLFDAGAPGWEAAAMMEKHQLRQNPPAELVGKVVHSQGWQKRLASRIVNF